VTAERITRAAAETATLFARPELGTIAVTGQDRVSWLNGLVTSDLTKVGPAVASYGLLLTKTGRILADAWIVAAEDRLLVGLQKDRIARVREHLETHLMMEDAAHEDVSAGFSWALAVGPKAAQVARDVRFAGEVDVLGVGAAAIVAPTLAGLAIAIGTEGDWDELRVRRCFPRFGVDYGEAHVPHEASLDKIAVSFTKGCYLGQEVVCRVQLQGQVKRKIVAIELPQCEVPAVGAKVRSKQGAELGTVSSQAGAIALAMIPVEHSDPGAVLDVAGTEARVIAI
jgi:tRNA-modifying protein YgfZ